MQVTKLSHRSVAFQYINNELAKKENKITITITIAKKKNKIPRNKFNQGGERLVHLKL